LRTCARPLWSQPRKTALRLFMAISLSLSHWRYAVRTRNTRGGRNFNSRHSAIPPTLRVNSPDEVLLSLVAAAAHTGARPYRQACCPRELNAAPVFPPKPAEICKNTAHSHARSIIFLCNQAFLVSLSKQDYAATECAKYELFFAFRSNLGSKYEVTATLKKLAKIAFCPMQRMAALAGIRRVKARLTRGTEGAAIRRRNGLIAIPVILPGRADRLNGAST